MYLFNEKEFILRLEYFGGLLINRNTMEKYQISMYDAIFLLSIKQHINVENIINFIYEAYEVKFEPDIRQYLILKIIYFANKDNLEECSTQEQYAIFGKIVEEVRNILQCNHLRSPIELTIYPTFKCKLNCDFCFLGKARSVHCKEYGYEYWVKLVKSFVNEGTASVSILGGEPSLYYDLIPLLYELDKLGIRVSLTTNGQNWSKELLDVVARLKNITIIISIESLELDSSVQKMGVKYNIQKSKRLIKELRSHGVKCRINSVYTNQTDKEIFDIVDLCASMGIEKYSIAQYFGIDEDMPTIKETNELGERVREYINEKSYNDLYFKIEGCMIYSSYTNINGKVVDTEFQRKQYGCECGNTILEIVPDGSVYSCAAFIARLEPIGNVFQGNWMEIWYNSRRLEYLRNTKCTDPVCMKCDLYQFCNGGCPAYKAYQGIKNEFQEYDSRCMLAKGK